MTSRTVHRRPAVRIVDVAALAGVSPGTASKALNGTGQLRPGTVERVRQAAQQLGFTPDGSDAPCPPGAASPWGS
ncbi:MAG: LacI family DNA-binding transcriptional regulator [Quadrisphaera sp.]